MATVYDNFLTEEECDYLLKLATPKMEPAMLVNSELQKHKKSKSRTSHGAFFDSFGDPVLAMITNRIGHVARIPPGACHVLRGDAASLRTIVWGVPSVLCTTAIQSPHHQRQPSARAAMLGRGRIRSRWIQQLGVPADSWAVLSGARIHVNCPFSSLLLHLLALGACLAVNWCS